jgi:hypothetical protein
MKNLRVPCFAYVLFAAFALTFVLLALLSAKPVHDLWSALAVAYKTIPILLLVVGLFVTYGWKWKIFRNWLVPFPDLNGTWQGTIQTTWKNPDTEEVPGPIPTILTIKHSFVKISCVMRTAEMTSRSYLADFWLDGNEQIRMLGYSYRSTPLPSVAARSQPHDGTMLFEIIGNPAQKLKGTYWSSRKTTGEIILAFREKHLLDDFPSEIGTHPVSKK